MKKEEGLKRVLVESPFKGETKEDELENIKYARACLKDCLRRGEAPYASHLIYTQEGVLDDSVSEERNLGIEAGLTWGAVADLTVVYFDRGISRGMQYGILRAEKENRPIEFRSIFGTENTRFFRKGCGNFYILASHCTQGMIEGFEDFLRDWSDNH